MWNVNGMVVENSGINGIINNERAEGRVELKEGVLERNEGKKVNRKKGMDSD